MAVNKNIRSAVELNNPDLNYFIAFRIDPTETDIKKIEQALIKKRNTFAAQQTVINSRLVELKVDIDEIMLNDSIYDEANDKYTQNKGGRAQEAKRAINFNFAKAEGLVRGICSRGYIWDFELQDAADKAGVKFDDLYDRVKHLFTQGIQYKKSDGAKREVSFRDFGKLDDNLKTLNKKNIYEFLEIPMSSTAQEVETKRNAKYGEIQKQAKSATQTAGLNLCGIIKNIAKSEKAKKEYDIYVLCKDSVWTPLKGFKDMGIKSINGTVLEQISQSMMQATKMSADETEKEIMAYLLNFDLVIEGGGSTKIDFEECPYDNCGQIYRVQPNLKHCPICGQPLEVSCWNCGKPHPFTKKQKSCTNCGSSKADESVFLNDVKAFNIKVNQLNITESELNIELGKIENKYQTRNKQGSVVAKQLQQLKATIATKVKEIAKRKEIYDKYVKEINTLMAKKLYMQAETELTKLKAADPTFDVKSIEATIKKAIDDAKKFTESAKQYLAKNDEIHVIEYCGKALEVCADYAMATQILKNFPPKDPIDVNATINRQTVKIEWKNPGNQTAVTYTVIRKIGSVPANDGDGTILASNLTINFFEDSAVSPATAYYYAVYAERGGVRSKLIHAKLPITLFLEVSSVHQELVTDAVKITWVAPDNVKAIEVCRKGGTIPPQSITDGEKITVDGLKGFIDTTIKENINSYLIRCKYTINGKDYYSPGLKATYKKIKIPKALENVKLNNVMDCDFELTFTEPENGTLKLYLSDKAIDFNFGHPEYRINFVNQCKGLKEIDYVNLAFDKVRFTSVKNTIKWVYPILTTDQLYVINKPLIVNTINGIENLNVINKNGNVTIEGDLVGNARNIYVRIGKSGYINTIDEKADQQIIVSKDQFLNDGAIKLQLSVGIHYITLFSEFMEGGQIIYSKPVKLPEAIDAREKVIVKYVFDYENSTRTSYKAKITFRAEEELVIPDIDVVRGYPRPLSKSAGVKVGSIEEFTLKKKFLKSGYWAEVKVTVDAAHTLKDKLALYFSDDSVKYIQLKEVLNLK